MLRKDPALEEFGLVIFDEFHERSLHADLGLALTLQTRAILRQDLRVLVMSATLEVGAVGAGEIRRVERSLQDVGGDVFRCTETSRRTCRTARFCRASPGPARWVLATSIAETSLTIEGIPGLG